MNHWFLLRKACSILTGWTFSWTVDWEWPVDQADNEITSYSDERLMESTEEHGLHTAAANTL